MKTLHRVNGLVHDLVVTRDGSVVTLWSRAGVRHTVLNLGAPHLPGLEYARNTLLALAFSPGAESALVLGLGGASIPRMLRAASPSIRVDGVEIEPELLEVARRYFELGEDPGFCIYLEDAAEYMARCRVRYDIIVLDAYVEEMIVPQCTTREFLENVRRSLTDAGLLVVNCMDIHAAPFRDLLARIASGIGPVSILHGRRSLNAVAFAPVRALEFSQLLGESERLQGRFPFMADLPRMVRRLRPLRS